MDHNLNNTMIMRWIGTGVPYPNNPQPLRLDGYRYRKYNVGVRGIGMMSRVFDSPSTLQT